MKVVVSMTRTREFGFDGSLGLMHAGITREL